MTTHSLSVDFTKFRAYLFYRLNALRGFFIVQTLLSLLTYPLVCVAGSAMGTAFINGRELENTLTGGTPEEERLLLEAKSSFDYAAVFAIIALLVAVVGVIAVFVIGYIVQIKSFSWLCKKERVDMSYSLPVSADTRFWGNFIPSMAVTFIPFAIATAFGSIYLKNYDWERLAKAVNPQTVSGYHDTVCFADSLIALMWAVVLAFFMFYAFTALVMSFCGRLGHAAVMPFVLSFCLFAAHFSCASMLEICRYGGDLSFSPQSFGFNTFFSLGSNIFLNIYNGLFDNCCYCFGETAPGVLVTALSRFLWAVNYSAGAEVSALAEPVCVVQAVLAAVISIAGAWLLVRQRGGEGVGRAYVFNAAKYAAQTVIAAAVLLLGSLLVLCSYDYVRTVVCTDEQYEMLKPQSDMITVAITIAVIVAAAGVFALSERLGGGRGALRGAKKLGFAGIRFAAATGATCILFVILLNSDGFGMRLPPVDDVAFVTVEFRDDIYSPMHLKELRDPKILTMLEEQVKKAHAEKPYNTAFEGLSEGYLGLNRIDAQEGKRVFGVIYTTKSGYNRMYKFFLSDESYRDIIDALAMPEMLLSDYSELHYSHTYRCEPIEYDEATEVRSITVGAGSVRIIATDDGSGESDESGEYHITTKGLTAKRLYDAIAADCEKVTPELLNRCRAGVYTKEIGVWMAGHEVTCTMYPWFDNTLSLLREYDIDLDFSVNVSRYKTGFLIKHTNASHGDNSGSDLRSALIGGWRTDELFGLAGDDRFMEHYLEDRYDKDAAMDEFYQQWENVSVKKLDLSDETTSSLIARCGNVFELFSRDTEYYVVLVDDDGSFMEAEEYDRPECEVLFVSADNIEYAEAFFDRLP